MPEDDDLLTPSLTPADDLGSFFAPWNPTHLLVITALFGIWPGGWLIARNYGRLGLGGPHLAGRALLAAGVVGLVGLVGTAWLATHGIPGWLDPADRHQMRNLRTASRVGYALAGAAIAWPQFRRWRVFEQSAQPAGKLFREALVAILVGGAASVGLGLVMLYGLGWKAAP